LAIAAIDGLLEGQRAKPLPPAGDTTALFALLARSENKLLTERGQELGTLWGNAAAIQATLAAINDPSLPVPRRVQAIESAKTLKNEAARDALLRLVSTPAPEPLPGEALRALGDIGGDAIAD